MARTGQLNFVGRRRMLEKCRHAVDAGQSVWLVGEHGVGKTALARRIVSGALYLPHSTPAKELLTSLLMECYGRGWYDPPKGKEAEGEDAAEAVVEKRIRRLDQKTAAGEAIKALSGQSAVLILDEFDQAPLSVVRVCRQIAPHATIIACGVSERAAQRPFLFGFERVEVKRLSRVESEELVKRLLDELNLDARERPALLRHIVEEAQGLPLVVHELVERSARKGDLSLKGVKREAVHGHTTVDMTPGMVIFACIILALRYAVRGLGDADLTVMAGLAAAVFMGLRFYAYRLAKPNRSRR